MNDPHPRATLLPDVAVELWLAGKDVWNEWVKTNSVHDICFQGVDFGKFKTKENPVISFEGYYFPMGQISFKGATFISEKTFYNEGVSFHGVHFKVGTRVMFSDVHFGAGRIDYCNVDFSAFEVTFEKADFSEASADFTNAKFSCIANFVNAKFGHLGNRFAYARFAGGVDFSHAEFGDGRKEFGDASFGGGIVSFNNTVFRNGDVDFHNSSFRSGNLYFKNTMFGKGTVNFFNSKLVDVSAYFDHARCYKTRFNFQNLTSNAHFEIRGINVVDELIFKNASFENVLSIVNVHVLSIPDLVNTKLGNQLSLHTLTCELNRIRHFGVFAIAVDTDDIERANRLKELSEANKHHSMSLHFHAIEQQAKRWQKQTTLRSSLLDLVFEKLCNYGQSVWRPLSLWLMTTALFAVLYTNFFKIPLTTVQQAGHGLIFSSANSLPFLNTANEGRNKALEMLFEKDIASAYILPLMMTQGVISVLMLFLVGLGLRNRFRM